MTNQLSSHDWTFLSNHSHVLYCIAFSPHIRIRDIALKVRITERAVQRIVLDLERGGYLKRRRVGRLNRYRLEPGLHLRHPLEHHVEVGRLLAVLQPGPAAREMLVQEPQDFVVVAAREISAVRSRTAAKAISHLKKKPRSRLKKKPAKPRKLLVKKSG